MISKLLISSCILSIYLTNICWVKYITLTLAINFATEKLFKTPKNYELFEMIKKIIIFQYLIS